MTETLVSIVVPIYNVKEYLGICVDSILAQTYRKLEIILVDDGSTDGSEDICDRYAKIDSRIKVIHQANGGLSVARNSGLKVAFGEYICFVDSDDYIEKTYVQDLFNLITENDADISICEYNMRYDRYICKVGCGNAHMFVMSSTQALREFFLEEHKGYVMAWNKMYKRRLFTDNDIYFPNGKVHEDCFTTYKLYGSSQKIVFLCKALYNYRQRNNSIMHTPNIDNDFLVIEASQNAYNYVCEREPELIMEAEYKCLISSLDATKNIMDWNNRAYLYKAKKNCQKYNWKRNKYLKGQRKIRICILIYFSMMYPLVNRLKRLLFK